MFKRAPELKKLHWLATDDLPAANADGWRDPGATLETLAFLQYTSGSTATPRGVMVTHGNLLHNLACLREVFQFSPESIGVTWLPHYHDMGLIGGLLQPVYAGGEMIVMPPSSFLQRPIRWLAAVTRYRATTMVAPNFAYELCVQKISAEQRAPLDLASVKVALCGAEPVRPDTLAQFAKVFGPCGFRQEAFRPAYGLAEATLIVSGHSDGGAPFTPAVLAEELQRNRIKPAEEGAAGSRVLVGCGGIAPDLKVVIVDPETLAPCASDRVGEIWVSGPSVARGYWRKPAETEQTFGAHLATGEGPFLRTGDLGFLDRGQLFVTGRLKDLIIIRGSNHYPQDLEHTVERSHRALRPACGAAFSIDVDGAERLVIVQEVNDRASVPTKTWSPRSAARSPSRTKFIPTPSCSSSREAFPELPAEKSSATPAAKRFSPARSMWCTNGGIAKAAPIASRTARAIRAADSCGTTSARSPFHIAWPATRMATATRTGTAIANIARKAARKSAAPIPSPSSASAAGFQARPASRNFGPCCETAWMPSRKFRANAGISTRSTILSPEPRPR